MLNKPSKKNSLFFYHTPEKNRQIWAFFDRYIGYPLTLQTRKRACKYSNFKQDFLLNEIKKGKIKLYT